MKDGAGYEEVDGSYFEETISYDDSFASVALNPTYSEDREGIALLRQIFPDESIQELRRLHTERIETERSRRLSQQQESSRESANLYQSDSILSSKHGRSMDLPENFLRLPESVAVLRFTGRQRRDNTAVYRYESLKALEQKLVHQLTIRGYSHFCNAIMTRAVHRVPELGLGMTLSHHHGDPHSLLVHSIPVGKPKAHDSHANSQEVTQSPSLKAGIQPGDILVGFNGQMIDARGSARSGQDLLWQAAELIRHSPNPIVIHFQRKRSFEQSAKSRPPPPLAPISYSAPSLLDETSLMDSSMEEADLLLNNSVEESEDDPYGIWSTPVLHRNGEPQTHQLVELLVNRGALGDKTELSIALSLYHERAWEMETTHSLRLGHGPGEHATIPLFGIRKALSVRILNSFEKDTQTAYTIWVYDVESGKEWFAPIRYYEDFADLRYAVISLIPKLNEIHFPRQQQRTNIFGSPKSNSENLLKAHCWQLEAFLRSLCEILYKQPPDPALGEVMVHVQSFLGCDAVQFSKSSLESLSKGHTDASILAEEQERFKRSLQCYIHRTFFLQPLTLLVKEFVENMRQKCPTLQDLESIESQGVENMQKIALEDLAILDRFLDFLQSTILEGCMDDFRSITQHEVFASLRKGFHGKKGEIAWNEIVREAVREQAEIEVYVPLRSVVSTYLVNGWRHEDMEAHFKMKELRKQSPSFFGVPQMRNGSEAWMSAASILKDTLECCTLPCAKLRAIVQAAREIARICAEYNKSAPKSTKSSDKIEELQQLGADQFLPILIYCVVLSDIERPCALCVLLRALCDKVSRIGEIGYYLASFEATVQHIRDFDLTEQRDQMQSFLSINLD